MPIFLGKIMPPVKVVEDNKELVDTSLYPNYATFPFEKFNPVQSRLFDFYNKDCNVVIAASTSAGKTICAEMMMAQEVRERGGKAMYLAPLRALAKEKIDDWTDPKHHFKDLNLSICTGDYRLTPSRKKELENSNIILMTSEMLNARCRNMNSEHNDWLRDVGTLVVDESHLLTVPGRGDHLEVGLMNFIELALNPRIVFLSATMPNVQQIAEWLSYSLTGKETYLLSSTYRPCPLGIHYEPYFNGGRYDDQEQEKINQTLEIIEENPEDRFLLFVHTKRTGEMLKRRLIQSGCECEFHNADLEKDQRHALEKKFREGKLKYVIATSTLAWGLNLPARRVVILGVHRGLTEVDTYDIWQMAGRAGRPGYDPRGDVYILLPESQEAKHRNRLKNHQPIESKLLDNIGGHYKTLAFHLVSEIHHGRIKNKQDVLDWYEKTLAKFQSKDLDDSIINDTINLLLQRGAIKEEDGLYKVTVVGMVSSMFYYSPFDVADLRRNFNELFKSHNENNEYWLSMALGNVDSLRMGIVSRLEREDLSFYQGKINSIFGKSTFLEPAVKGGFAYYCCLTDSNPGNCAGVMRLLQWDVGRLIQVLKGLDSYGCKWGKSMFFSELQDRVLYKVRPELIRFVKLPDIGKVRAERLWSLGFRTLQDVVNKSEVVKNALNFKQDKVNDIIREAKNLIMVGED